ncbi:MAG: SIMPL domain-containing protein [Prevotella sp.]|nr:SIMPL domain-containing protein [Prevotella sp.]MDO5526644.1 SIMPL domain-containing protein [Prevotella sp.]
MMNRIKEAAILAAGIIILGVCIKWGIDDFAEKDRQVTVKGLAEKEVEADKVTWPIQTKELGNDLATLYSNINATTATIKAFLIKNGVKENEIEVNAPTVIDMNANQYNQQINTYRYNITSTVTVTSRNVKLVRGIIARQGELLKQGVAVIAGDYENRIQYEYVSFQKMKPEMMQEAIKNAQTTAEKFAENSNSKINKIMRADQGQFSIDDRDANTPYIKKVRVVTTVTYSLKD